MYLIFLFTAIAGFIFSANFLLNFKKGKTYPILVPLTFIYSLSSLISYGLLTDFFTKHPCFIGTPAAIVFLFTPVFYFFFALQSGYTKKLTWTAALHFIPFLQDLIFFMPFYLMPGEQKLLMIDKPVSGFSMMIIFFGIIYRWVYIALIIRILRKMMSTEKANRRFLFSLFSLHAFFVIIGTISKIFRVFAIEENVSTVVLSFSGLSGLCVIFYFFLRHRNIFKTDFFAHAKSIRKYSTSSLSSKEIRQIDELLQNIIKTEKPYLDPDITLRTLAQKINVLPNNLSQVINHTYGENFNRFINRHRINAVKELLKDPQKNILEAAYACGFNSKSSFNHGFKEICKQTPTEFRKNRQNK